MARKLGLLRSAAKVLQPNASEAVAGAHHERVCEECPEQLLIPNVKLYLK